MGFNADQWVAAQARPSITIDGETHTGKLLSFDEILPFQERMATIEQEEASPTDIRDLARDLCTALHLPAEKVLSLPMGAVLEAIKDFFGCLTGTRSAENDGADRASS